MSISHRIALALVLVVATPAEAEQPVRGTTRTSVNPSRTHDRNVDANRNVNRNVDRNVDVNRNVNVNRDIDVDVDVGHYHPAVRATAAVATAAVATAAVVGTVATVLPSNCVAVVRGGITYQRCGGVWYQPRYAGTQVSYVVVDAP